MFDEIQAKLPGSVVVVGTGVGFHDDGGTLARRLRTRLLCRLLTQLGDGTDPTEATLRADAADVLAGEDRANQVLLTVCLVLTRADEVHALVCGHYDVWHVAGSEISRVLAGSSLWNAAPTDVKVEPKHKNICVSALSSEPSAGAVHTARFALAPSEAIVITRGDVSPALVGLATQRGPGELVIAVPAGPGAVEVTWFGRLDEPNGPVMAGSTPSHPSR